ncbi:MAG: 3-deoxy-manno-octulosonate cytidylyltransferase [Bacteroidetes bacterium]|nr:3-deoxy-manno-octulosonate cytidylyltransferase [Bacteroidota bacterium]
MKFIGIIPSRYDSTRLPGKPLLDIGGKSMIQRVYEQVSLSKSLDKVIVATDNEEIRDVILKIGGEAVITGVHNNGTERCNEIIEKMDEHFDAVINIQGDEPFIQPEQIDLLCTCFHSAGTNLATLVRKIVSNDDLDDTSVIKVIRNKNGDAIYFSRTALPFMRDKERSGWLREHDYFKHIQMYGYRSETLKEVANLEPTFLERAESLEQLRWLEHGYIIKTAITEHDSLSVDTPEDLKKAELISEGMKL